MILIIDFGAGNLRSVQKAFELFNSDVRVSSDPLLIAKADRLVLPGVAAFGDSIKNIEELKLKEPILEFVSKGRPFIGICIGMQLLLTQSSEKGDHKGLNIIPGRVLKFPDTGKVPQIGWNQVRIKNESSLFKDIPDNTYYYFVHSYYVNPDSEDCIAGLTDYSVSYTSVIAKENVFGVQFHPEKSQKAGLKIIDNFCKL